MNNKNIKKIFTGSVSNSNFLISENDELYGFGHNLNYQLGLGTCDSILLSTLIKIKTKINIKDITSNDYNTFILDNSGCVYVSGKVNKFSYAISNGKKLITNFEKINYPSTIKMKKITSGGCDYVILLTDNNKILCDGENPSGQLGLDTMKKSETLT